MRVAQRDPMNHWATGREWRVSARPVRLAARATVGRLQTIGDDLFGIEYLTTRMAQLESQVRIQGEALNAMAQQLGIDPVVVDPIGQLDAEELSLVRAGKTIPAIKHHRVRTGSSLLQAKEAVDRAQR